MTIADRSTSDAVALAESGEANQRASDQRIINLTAALVAAAAAGGFFKFVLLSDTVNPVVGVLLVGRLALAIAICYLASGGRNWARWWLVFAAGVALAIAPFRLWDAVRAGRLALALYELVLFVIFVVAVYTLSLSPLAARFYRRAKRLP